VVVPESALLQQADQVQLYVVGAENKADLRSVKTGARTGGRVQILEGVQAGENVIAEGHQKIGPGSPVTFDAGTSTGTAKP
jgi:multidrug efflux pump subunit AcrA (membrane-fusion protein)